MQIRFYITHIFNNIHQTTAVLSHSWKRTFAFIWTGQLFSSLSSSVVSFAVIFWLSIQTGSAQVLALATISAMLPQLVLGLFTGVLVDRWDRKRTMIIADMYIAAVTAVMAVLFYIGKAEIGFIYVLLAFRSIGSAFYTPAMEASVPLLAPQSELTRVAGVNNMIFSISTIAAPGIAAVLISALDMTWVLMFDVLGAIIACTSLMFVVIPHPRDIARLSITPQVMKTEQSDSEAGKQEVLSEHKDIEVGKTDLINANLSELAIITEFRLFLAELYQGLRAILNEKGLMWMFVFTIFASLAMVPVSTLFPLMTLEHFAGDTYKMSIVEIAWGAGMLLGGGLMSLPKFKFNSVVLINTMYVIIGLTYTFSGFLPASGFYPFVALTFIGGIAGAIFWGNFTVLLQTTLDSAVLGRVFSIHGSLIMIPALLSLVLTGFIADTIGISNAFIICGAVLCAIGIVSSYVPAIRQMMK